MNFSALRRSLWSGVVLASLMSATPACGAPASRDLASFEREVDSSLTVLAAEKHIQATGLDEGQQSALAGMGYFASSQLGPRSDIVTRQVNNQSFRFAQTVGVELPLFGRRSAQQEAIIESHHQGELARIALADTRRQVLAKLREAYTLYWQSDRDAAVDAAFFGRQQMNMPKASTLVKAGFWTKADLLDFLVVMQKTRADLDSVQSSGRAQLAAMQSALGVEIEPFSPADPTLDQGCTESVDAAASSAQEADALSSQIDAQIEQYRGDLEQVRHSSIDAAATAGAGAVTDLPQGLGYDVTVGVAVTVPRHGRLVESDRAKELLAEIEEQQLLKRARTVELRSAVELALADLKAARITLDESLAEEASKKEALRESEVRFATMPTTDKQLAFNAVQLQLVQTYAAERAAVDARAAIWLKTTDLLLLAPHACTTVGQPTDWSQSQ